MILGIDPGKSGGLALLGSGSPKVWKMPETLMDLWNLLHAIAGESAPTAYIENVHSMPGQGVSSTFKFGQNFGSILMAVTAAEIPYELVAPTTWQRTFGLLRNNKTKRNETSVQKKNRHKEAAQRLFPKITITHAIADALLLAEHGRRVRMTTCKA